MDLEAIKIARRKVNEGFRHLRKQWQDLNKFHVSNGASDEYWKLHELFRISLDHFIIHYRFGRLEKKDFMQICAWASTYRPQAPHVFLGRISDELDHLNGVD